MKKGCSIIFVIMVILWLVGTFLTDESEGPPKNDDVRPERALATRLNNSTFFSDEGGLHSSIEFTSDNTGWLGVATLTQLGCRFVYGYSLEGDKILLTYTGSDCGRPSNDQTFYYDQTEDYIYTMIHGQKFIFK
jgi:hypothetical protein